MQYAYREWPIFLIGFVFLFAGSVGDFVVPLYVGLVTNALAEENYEVVNNYCLQLFCIVCVSKLN